MNAAHLAHNDPTLDEYHALAEVRERESEADAMARLAFDARHPDALTFCDDEMCDQEASIKDIIEQAIEWELNESDATAEELRKAVERLRSAFSLRYRKQYLRRVR